MPEGWGMAKISIQVTTWNSRKYLKDCFDSIFSQDWQDFSVLVIDNASTDKTVEFIKQSYPGVYSLENVRNLGFAKANNQGIKITESEFILVMNPDIVLNRNFLTRLVRAMERDKKIASAGGKLLKIKLGDIELDEKIRTKIIDSTGLKILKSRRALDRGEGEQDLGQYDRARDVFGISGACVLYRREALEDIKVPIIRNSYIRKKFVIRSKADEVVYEYFDENFFAYKEDIDLAWRLRLRGWKAVYVPGALAYHFRGVTGHKGRLRKVDLAIQARKTPMINFYAYRNHLWMLLKNSFWSNLFRHFWFIFFYQLKKELYLLFTQPGILIKGSLAFWKGYCKMMTKRKYILGRAKLGPGEMRKWFR